MIVIVYKSRNFLAGMLFALKEMNIFAVWYLILDFERTLGLWNTGSSWLRIVEHARGRSSLLLRFFFVHGGKEAMNEPEFKFNKRWNDFSWAIQGNLQGEMMENKFNSDYTFFWSSEMKKIVIIIDAWIRQGQGEHGHFFLKLVFIEFFSWDWWVKFRLRQRCRYVAQRCLPDPERNAGYVRKFKPRYFMFIDWSRFWEDLAFWKVSR